MPSAARSTAAPVECHWPDPAGAPPRPAGEGTGPTGRIAPAAPPGWSGEPPDRSNDHELRSHSAVHAGNASRNCEVQRNLLFNLRVSRHKEQPNEHRMLYSIRSVIPPACFHRSQCSHCYEVTLQLAQPQIIPHFSTICRNITLRFDLTYSLLSCFIASAFCFLIIILI